MAAQGQTPAFDTAVPKAATNVSQTIAERPECTLSAIRRAIKVGATAVEVDVRSSRDGELSIPHDSTLDPTTDGTGPAPALTLAELQQHGAVSWFVTITELRRYEFRL